jgi:uncharacterized protein YndB with AHSA1/START domain
MTKRTINQNIWIDASPERIWQAINDPTQLAQWLLPPALHGSMKRSNDKGFILLGPMEVPVFTFTAINQPHQVTVCGFPDGLISATFRLTEDKGGTLVAVTMGGFESLLEDAYQERVGPGNAGWEKALQNLKAHIDDSELPYPQGYVASLLGYRKEADAKYAIERSIWFNAPRERVWQAITDPEQIRHWFSPGTQWRLTALAVGGQLSVVDAETGADKYANILEVVEPPHHLVLRSVPEPPDTLHEVTTYTLREEKGGTRLILTSAGYEVLPAEERHQRIEQNAFGFGMMLENLQAYLMDEPLPYPFGF